MFGPLGFLPLNTLVLNQIEATTLGWLRRHPYRIEIPHNGAPTHLPSSPSNMFRSEEPETTV